LNTPQSNGAKTFITARVVSHGHVELDQGVELLLVHEAIRSADFPALLTPAQPVPPPLAPIMSQFSRRT
jgi:hypothetical protein